MSKFRVPLESCVGSHQTQFADESTILRTPQDIGVSHHVLDPGMSEQLSVASTLLLRDLGIMPGETGLVINGRVSAIKQTGVHV